ncbi:hypothetical protein MMPV_000524 [Pyropia vietnamensis]
MRSPFVVAEVAAATPATTATPQPCACGGTQNSRVHRWLRPPPWAATTSRPPHHPRWPAADAAAGDEATSLAALPSRRPNPPPTDAAAIAAAISTALRSPAACTDAVEMAAPASTAREYLPHARLVRAGLSALLLLSVAAAATVPIGLLADVARAAATAAAVADAAAAGHRAAWTAAGCGATSSAPGASAAATSSVGIGLWIPRSVRVWQARRAATACAAAAAGGRALGWAPRGLVASLSVAAPAASIGGAVDAVVGGLGWGVRVTLWGWALFALMVVWGAGRARELR